MTEALLHSSLAVTGLVGAGLGLSRSQQVFLTTVTSVALEATENASITPEEREEPQGCPHQRLGGTVCVLNRKHGNNHRSLSRDVSSKTAGLPHYTTQEKQVGQDREQ